MSALFICSYLLAGCTAWHVRWNIKSGAELASSSSLPKLAAAARSGDWRAAIDAAKKHGDAGAPAIAAALENKEVFARIYACIVLSEIASPSVASQLIQALGDSDGRVRQYAAEALGNAAPPNSGARQALQRVSKDEDSLVSRAARLALNKMGNRSAATLVKPAKIVAKEPTTTKAKPCIVAVFSVEAKPGSFSNGIRDRLTHLLLTGIAGCPRYRVVPARQLRKGLAEMKARSYKDCYDRRCQIEIGRALAAQITVASRVVQIDKRCFITSIMYDLKTETTQQAATAEGACDHNAIVESIKTVVRKLCAN